MDSRTRVPSLLLLPLLPTWSFPGGSAAKNLPVSTGDVGSIPESGRPPGDGNCNPLQYSCLGNPMDTGAWQDIVHGVAKSQTQLSDYMTTRGQKEQSPVIDRQW